MADKFDEATQKELSDFLEQQQTQAKFHARVHSLTSMCWDKCVTGTPSTSFSRSEESCLQNCVGRFLDSSIYIVKQVERQREQQVFSG
ncbi:Tim10/DDP family zinc finger-domain-containing protein [Cyathus striatus]|nr:Tim10/DDP family zinc finger-domain-containing protein [Cyathus striatus]